MYDPDIYNEAWFEKRHKFHWDIGRITARFIEMFGPFETSLDLGAGDGWYSYILASQGSDAVVVELHERALKYLPTSDVVCIIHDLRAPLDLGRKFDLVLCIEVAEHLPKSGAGILCDTIALHCGQFLLFSAAPPGQEGVGHVNCQPAESWIKKLEARGLMYLSDGTLAVKLEWEHLLADRGLPWLPANVMLFEVQDENPAG